jgi:hypothetical protein
MKRTCVQCGKDFFLSDNEIKFYKDKELSLPKRCKECRDANKRGRDGKKEDEQSTAVNGASKPQKNKSSRKKLAGIAAAVVVLAAGGGIYSQNAAGTAVPPQQPAYEYTIEAEDNTVYTAAPEYTFRNKEFLDEHYEKHGRDMGFSTAEEYEAAASAVVNDPRALHKLEAEDGDDVYYIEETNEFVIVSKAGYLRTYFKPDTGRRYYDRQ